MEKRYDAIIVGGGPAGLSAAIYMARAQFHVLVIEKDTIGGQITITGEVVNYPGIPYTNGKKINSRDAQSGRKLWRRIPYCGSDRTGSGRNL